MKYEKWKEGNKSVYDIEINTNDIINPIYF